MSTISDAIAAARSTAVSYYNRIIKPTPPTENSEYPLDPGLEQKFESAIAAIEKDSPQYSHVAVESNVKKAYDILYNQRAQKPRKGLTKRVYGAISYTLGGPAEANAGPELVPLALLIAVALLLLGCPDPNESQPDPDDEPPECYWETGYNQYSSSYAETKEIPITIHHIVDEDGERYETYTTMDDYIDRTNSFFESMNAHFIIIAENDISRENYDIELTSSEVEQIRDKYHQEGAVDVFFYYSPEEGAGSCREKVGVIIPYQDIDSPNKVVLAHELGHYFDLLHTHYGFTDAHDLTELVDGSNCTAAGDLICDTPADPGSSRTSAENPCEYNAFTCEITYCPTDANGDTYSPDITNIMSYYGSCRDSFTPTQFQVIHCAMEKLFPEEDQN